MYVCVYVCMYMYIYIYNINNWLIYHSQNRSSLVELWVCVAVMLCLAPEAPRLVALWVWRGLLQPLWLSVAVWQSEDRKTCVRMTLRRQKERARKTLRSSLQPFVCKQTCMYSNVGTSVVHQCGAAKFDPSTLSFCGVPGKVKFDPDDSSGSG